MVVLGPKIVCSSRAYVVTRAVTEPGVPIDPAAAQRAFETALGLVREVMAREYRAATHDELARLRTLVEEP